MAQKNITGDLNVTGTYKQNGTALATGTRLYKHVIANAYEANEIEETGTLVVISTNGNPVTTTQELYNLQDNSIGISLFEHNYHYHLVCGRQQVIYITSKLELQVYDDCSFAMGHQAVDTVTEL